MSELETLLARRGLEPGLRILTFATAAIARGDWTRLEHAVALAERTGEPRTGFEECLLQGVLFFGFPRIVSAFEVLCRAWPANGAPTGGGLEPEHQRQAGRALFDAIYDHNAPAVHAMLRGFHAELHDFVLESAYGRILSRPAMSPRDRELLAVAGLAALDQIPQLVAHARGARRFGASDTEIREALVSALGDVEANDDHLRRIG